MSLSENRYLNKDFQTIYPELLDLAKKLSARWDPTISNESDPGVVLIKLNALLADKNNYAIDRSLLECFPSTVTQEGNAVQLFDQLGYTMAGYRSATGELSFLWDKDSLYDEQLQAAASVSIPAFTMFSNEDKSIVYTLTENVDVVADKYAMEVRGKCVQGVVRNFEVYASTKITYENIDSSNRLYFPIRNVAENGIFIAPYELDTDNMPVFNWSSNFTFATTGKREDNYWERVENLQSQPSGTKCYKTGVDQYNNSFYIEFPEDYASLIGNGIQIKYLQTDGLSGNVGAGIINSFYDNCVDGDVQLHTDVKVLNRKDMLDGSNPETIDSAYNSYKKQVGTFNTLVTLRDYLNHMLLNDSGIVSNGVVSDRTCDIQSSYKIMSARQNDTWDTITNYQEVIVPISDTNSPEMSAFDLKTYFLTYSPICEDLQLEDFSVEEIRKYYNQSFDLLLNSNANDSPLATPEEILRVYDNSKSLQHNFIAKLMSKESSDGESEMRPLFIKNKFKLKLSIVPSNYVTESQAKNLEDTLLKHLYANLSADKLEFSKEPLYETVYDICNSATDNIKAIALDPIQFTSYAVVYIDGVGIREIELPQTLNGTSVTFENEKEMSYATPDLQVKSERYLKDNSAAWKIAADIMAKSILCGSTALFSPNTGLHYSLLMDDAAIYDPVTKVSTSMSITFDNEELLNKDGQTLKLTENESLIFYSPLLKSKTTYSTGMKYVYYTTSSYSGKDSTIPANVDYELETGQVLYLFWKEEDSSSAPYMFDKLTSGTIIKSSIPIQRINGTSKESLMLKLESLGHGSTGQILGTTNDIISDIMDTILSTTKTIETKELSEVELKEATKYCTWITNDTEYDETDNKLKSVITFDKRVETFETVDKTYQDGLIYFLVDLGRNANNRGSSIVGGLDRHTLAALGSGTTGGQAIYVFRPNTYDVEYNVYDEFTGCYKKNVESVTDYIWVDTISAGSDIRCTGDLYSLLKIAYDGGMSTSTIHTYLSGLTPPATIRHGNLETTVVPGSDKETQRIVRNEVAIEIEALKNILTLSNGHRIDKLLPENQTTSGVVNGYVYYDYVVGNNENFFYTNAQKDSLEILGTGSRVTIKKYHPLVSPPVESLSFKCVAIPKEDTKINPSGGHWIDIDALRSPHYDSMFVNLSTVVALGYGSELKVRRIGEEVYHGVPVGANNNSTGSSLTRIVTDPAYAHLKIDSTGIYRRKDADSEWKKDSNTLGHFTVLYKNSSDGDASYTELPRTRQSKLSWNGWATLNLKCTKNSPQFLDPSNMHRIEVTYLDWVTASGPSNKELKEFTTSISSTSMNTKFINFSTGLDMTGGSNIDLRGTDLSGSVVYPRMIVYGTMPAFYEGGSQAHRFSVVSSANAGTESTTISRDVNEDRDGNKNYEINKRDADAYGVYTTTYQIGDLYTYGANYSNSESFQYLMPFRVNALNGVGSTTSLNPISVPPYGAYIRMLGKLKSQSGSEVSEVAVNIKILGGEITHLIPDRLYYAVIEVPAKVNDEDSSFTICIEHRGCSCRICEPKIIDYSILDLLLPAGSSSEEGYTQTNFMSYLGSLDQDCLFDYSYLPSGSINIPNPLSPRSFFSKYHPYNAFTIPQISSIEVTTTNRREY